MDISEVTSYEILLASRSPRRQLLMEGLGIPYRVVEPGHTDESYPGTLGGGEIACYLAERKSDAYSGNLLDGQILLTADTVVWQNGRELGKPAGREEAISMLRRLSGGTHQVYTGVCLRAIWDRRSFHSVTGVTFSRLEEPEVVYYVDRYRPFDKAGAYGIQEWIGYIAVEGITGSYFNVMGLPVHRVYHEVKRLIRDRS